MLNLYLQLALTSNSKSTFQNFMFPFTILKEEKQKNNQENLCESYVYMHID